MSRDRIEVLAIGTAIGALLGFGIALLATDARKEKNQLAENGAVVRIHPNARDWVTFAAAAIALARQFARMIEPKQA